MKKYLLFLILILAPAFVSADLGPKPTMLFSLEKELPNAPLVSGELFECSDPSCSDMVVFRQMGPQRFSCNSDESGPGCFSMAYNYQPYHRLSLTFSDKTRTSNIFALAPNNELESRYLVTIGDNDLTVRLASAAEISTAAHYNDLPSSFKKIFDSDAGPSNPADYIFFMVVALLTTVIIELIVVALFKKIKNSVSPRLATILIANLISLPLLWLVAYYSNVNYYIFIIVGELAVVLFEAFYIALRNGDSRAWSRWLALSFIMNAASFFVGNWLLGLFM